MLSFIKSIGTKCSFSGKVHPARFILSFLSFCVSGWSNSNKGDYKTPNEDLFNKIQNVYSEYFKPEIEYKHGSFKYTNAPNYGYVDFEKREYYGKREYTADEYVAFCGTHCDHIVIPEPYRSMFFNGLKEAVLEAGNKIVFHDTFILFLTKKQLYSQVS